MSYPQTYPNSLHTTVARVSQNLAFPSFICGGVNDNDGTYILSKRGASGEYGFHMWRSPTYKIGMPFTIMEVKFFVIPGILPDQDGILIPKISIDNGDTEEEGTTISKINYPDKQLIILNAKNFANQMHGTDNFYFELQFTGTDLVTVGLPIVITLEVADL